MKRLVFLFFAVLLALPAVAEKALSWDSSELTDLVNLAIGEGDAEAFKKCLGILEPLAKAGDVKAQTQLGGMLCALYSNGYGTLDAEKKGLEWLQQAAKRGHVDACQTLGAFIRDDHEAAVKWMRLAAEKNNPEALHMLGAWYEYGTHQLPINPSKAAQFYLKAAQLGDESAMCTIARFYREGKGLEKNPIEESKWFAKAAETQRNDYPRYMLGRNYEEGRGVPQDFQKAFHWYQRAAEFRSGNAYVALAWCYTRGQGVEVDFEKALYYLNLSEQLPCNEYEKERRDEITDLLHAYAELNP